jgi:hypothetical protein
MIDASIDFRENQGRMRQELASGSTSIAHLFTGDRRLKRVLVKIKSPKCGEREFTGHALINELNETMFSFFCTEKFSIDEELEICVNFSGQELTYRVLMSHLHEQISSGRIMNAIPSEENPFPARKFYRCFSKVLELKGMKAAEPQATEPPVAGTDQEKAA